MVAAVSHITHGHFSGIVFSLACRGRADDGDAGGPSRAVTGAVEDPEAVANDVHV